MRIVGSGRVQLTNAYLKLALAALFSVLAAIGAWLPGGEWLVPMPVIWLAWAVIDFMAVQWMRRDLEPKGTVWF